MSGTQSCQDPVSITSVLNLPWQLCLSSGFCSLQRMWLLEAPGPQACTSKTKRKGLFPCWHLINPQGKDSGWPSLVTGWKGLLIQRSWSLSEQWLYTS